MNSQRERECDWFNVFRNERTERGLSENFSHAAQQHLFYYTRNYYRFYILMSAYSAQMSHLKQVIVTLQENLNNLNHKTNAQKQLCTEYMHIFQKFSKSLAGLTTKFQQQTNKLEGKNSDSILLIFKCLANVLGKISNNAKNVAIKSKNKILDPLRLFTDNCMSLNKTFLHKLKSKQSELMEKYSQLYKNKQNYIAASQRLQKNRKTQSKLMTKIQNGDISELQKFNQNIRKITENIKQTEDQYSNSVKAVNKCLDELREQLKQISTSMSYNQQSRVTFTKKTLLFSVKNLKQFCLNQFNQLELKLDQDLQCGLSTKNQTILNANLNSKISLIINSQKKEEVVTFSEMLKKRRKKILEEQNSHLTQVFSKVKEQDKFVIKKIVKNWFTQQLSDKQISSMESNIKDWQSWKQKIITVLPYSYFFIQAIYEQISQMSSIYSKLDEENFMLLLQLFINILKNLKLKQTGSMASISIQFAYRMLHISMRIMWKKSSKIRNQPIELLCQHLGKKSKQLYNQQIYYKIYSYLQKKKIQKKIPANNQSSKGMMDSFMKGMQEAMNIKKQVKLSEQQSFGCLTQLTYIMANLLTPNEIAIPIIKKLLGKGENTKSFEYLKAILFEKKDQQERQKIFFRTQIKGKMELQIKKVTENKKVAEYCLKLIAQRGFFSKSQLNIRLVSRQLKYIHREILYKLQIPANIKWLHMMPYDKNMKYQQMVKQAEEKRVAAPVQQIIILDVNRSLHNHTEKLTQETLKRLLIVYAYYHNDIGYCQGMNYIAGYLYIKVEKEESAYRMFEYLMEERFKELFANEFQVLKIKLYQFERLLAIFHPEISDHFKRQGITSECYIVAWIITVFASSYQYTQESYLIDLLWERFMIWGWREFFRFVLALFNVHREELIQLTYDKAMHFLGNIARSDILKCGKSEFKVKYATLNIEESIQHYEISQELLQNLQKQYQFK